MYVSFAMEMAAILVHSLNRFSLCMAVAKLLLCCDIICKFSIYREVVLCNIHYEK